MKRKKDTRGDLMMGRAKISGYDAAHLSARAGIKLSTLYKRIKLPGTMTINELRSVDRVIGFTVEELVKMIRDA
jgi:hypothetical protein